MLSAQTKQVLQLPLLHERKKLVRFWAIGLILIALTVFVDTKWQVWNNAPKSTILYILVLGGGVSGILMQAVSIFKFQKWPQVIYTAYGRNEGLDERDLQHLLQAQVKAQRMLINGVIFTNVLVLTALSKGIHLSWWSCMLGLNGLVSLLTYLPTAILAWTEPDLEG